jgi:hypothetical protein
MYISPKKTFCVLVLNVIKIITLSWVWCYMPIISAFRRLREEGCEFSGCLGFIDRSCLKKKKQNK